MQKHVENHEKAYQIIITILKHTALFTKDLNNLE